jgi:hypothetical protein
MRTRERLRRDTETASEGEMEVYPEGSEYAGGDVLVSLSDLREIKDLFDEYEEQGGMEIDDFIEKFGAILRKRSQGITDTDLALMFMRFDANANRSDDWGEISTYLLMHEDARGKFVGGVSWSLVKEMHGRGRQQRAWCGLAEAVGLSGKQCFGGEQDR